MDKRVKQSGGEGKLLQRRVHKSKDIFQGKCASLTREDTMIDEVCKLVRDLNPPKLRIAYQFIKELSR